MKEITIPATTTYSFFIDIKAAQTALQNGDTRYDLGALSVGGDNNEQDVIIKNAGKILYASTSIEKKLDRIISLYVLGPFKKQQDGRDFFENEILGSSFIGLNQKTELVKKIINECECLKGKEKHNLFQEISLAIKWRNAFAHGSLRLDNKAGWLLEYFSGKRQSLSINDVYWDEVERVFKQIFEYLTLIESKFGTDSGVSHGL